MKHVSMVLLWILATTVMSFAQTTFYLPQIVNGVQSDGLYWKTTFLMTNTAPATSPGAVTFYFLNSRGIPPFSGPVDPECCGSMTLAIQGGHTDKVVSDGEGSLSVGYARVVSWTDNISVTAIFSEYSPSGDLISEASIPVAQALSKQAIFIDNQNGLSTGVAFVNPATETATITLELLDAQGQLVGPPIQRPLAGLNQSAAFVSELFPQARNVVGTMRITSSVPISVTALRFSPNGVFTTVPIIPQ
jgi:hypothetical protein